MAAADNKAKTEMPAPIWSSAVLKVHDPQLAANKEWAALAPTYEAQPSADALAKAVKALEEKKHKVTVVDTPAAALAAITGAALPDKASVAFGTSITLQQIGLIDYVKGRADLKNYRAEALALQAAGDWPGASAKRAEGMFKADVFYTSVCAVTQDGCLVSADASGTRVTPLTAGAKSVVVVVSANKIVADEKAARERLEKWIIPIESAHMRETYKIPGTSLNNFVVVRSAGFTPGRIHVVVVKGHVLGY